jgi:hypothetical protein
MYKLAYVRREMLRDDVGDDEDDEDDEMGD